MMSFSILDFIPDNWTHLIVPSHSFTRKMLVIRIQQPSDRDLLSTFASVTPSPDATRPPSQIGTSKKGISMSGKKSFVFSLIVLAVVCMASVRTSRADTVTFTLGNNPQNNEENILLNSGVTGNPVFGLTNQSNISVRFSSNTDTLSEPSSGQARVEAVDGLLNNITISIPGGSFEDIILNPFFGSGLATVTVTTTTNNVSTFSYTLTNGNNFLTIFDTGGTISSVTISAPGGFTDLRQPRISGAQLNTQPVPEPATIFLLGSGLLGVGSTLRKRRR